MAQINAYLGFNGKCREAMTFYKECLGGELTLQTMGDSPMKDKFPASMKDKILHSSLMKNDVLLLMGSDMVGPDGFNQGNNFSLSLNCSSEEEINTFFSNLSAEGKVLDSLKLQFWGDLFGVVKDKFGVAWMLNYHKAEEGEKQNVPN